MVSHTKDSWDAYLVESAYGCGKAGGTIAVPVPAAAVGDLTAASFPYKAPISLPYVEENFVTLKAPGHAIDTVQSFSAGYNYAEFKRTQLLQSNVWLAAMIAMTAGTTPTSYGWHHKPGAGDAQGYDTYGCIPVKLKHTFTAPGKSGNSKEGFVVEELTFDYFDNVASAYSSTVKSYLTTAPKVFGNFTFSIGATPVILQSASYEIDVILKPEEGNSGRLQRAIPYVESRTFKCDLEFQTDDGALLTKRERGASLSLVDLSVAGFFASTTTLGVTNLNVKTTNINELPLEGLFNFKCSLENGGATVISLA